MLPRSRRLVAADDHREVARRGRRSRRGPLTVKCILASSPAGVAEPARLAVVVPKVVGSAPERNRLRRRLRHLAVARLDALPPGSRIVVRADEAAARLTSAALAPLLAAALADVTR